MFCLQVRLGPIYISAAGRGHMIPWTEVTDDVNCHVVLGTKLGSSLLFTTEPSLQPHVSGFLMSLNRTQMSRRTRCGAHFCTPGYSSHELAFLPFSQKSPHSSRVTVSAFHMPDLVTLYRILCKKKTPMLLYSSGPSGGLLRIMECFWKLKSAARHLCVQGFPNNKNNLLSP